MKLGTDWGWCLYSYTCGGVGHLSRDCVQGSKCYNCSGVVRGRLFIFLNKVCITDLIACFNRVTLAGTALNPRSVLAILVVLKGSYTQCFIFPQYVLLILCML